MRQVRAPSAPALALLHLVAVLLVTGCSSSGGGGGSTGDARAGDDDDDPADAAPADDGGAPPGADARPAATVAGCDGASLLANPADPAARGPWPVGARTVTIGRLTAEIWYPAIPGSDDGVARHRYDIRAALPPSQRAIIPDIDNPWQACECSRDLPLDTAHGPYPVVIFVHGTAAFRHQSLTQVTHWASRGFVVVAANHPGLMLGDLLGGLCGDPASGPQDLNGDVAAELAAVSAATGDLDFLAGHVDLARVGVAGHSAGGGAAAAAADLPGVQVVIALAGAATTAASDTLASTLYMSGREDGIATPETVARAWSGSPRPRRLISITGAGHLAFSDLCETRNRADDNLLAIATQYELCGAQLAGLLFDCDEANLDGPRGWAIINHASSTVLEATLQCATDMPDLAQIQATYPDVAEYQEAL